MADSSARYSPALKKKVLELRKNEDLTAEEVAERINNMKAFEDEPELSASSVYGLASRYGNGNGGNGTKAKKAKAKTTPCHVAECLATFKGDVVTLTLSFPKNRHLQVLRQLGITE